MSYKPNDEIMEVIADIYETHKICEFGFDVIKLCKNMGYLVIPYSSFSRNKIRILKKNR